jgi:hypothetical protein
MQLRNQFVAPTHRLRPSVSAGVLPGKLSSGKTAYRRLRRFPEPSWLLLPQSHSNNTSLTLISRAVHETVPRADASNDSPFRVVKTRSRIATPPSAWVRHTCHLKNQALANIRVPATPFLDPHSIGAVVKGQLAGSSADAWHGWSTRHLRG